MRRNQRKTDIRGKIVFDFELSKQSCYLRNNQTNAPLTPVASARTGHASIKKTQSFNKHDRKSENSAEYTTDKKCQNEKVFCQQTSNNLETFQASNLSADQLSFKLVCYDFKAIEKSDLSVHIGQWVRVIEKSDSDWWLVRTSNGNEGYVPSNFLIDVPILPTRKLAQEPKINTFDPKSCEIVLNEKQKSEVISKKYKPKTATIIPMTATVVPTVRKIHGLNNETDSQITPSEKDLKIKQLREEFRGFMRSNSDASKLKKCEDEHKHKTSGFPESKPEWRRSFSGNQKKVRFLDSVTSNNYFEKNFFNKEIYCNKNYGELIECATWC